MTDRLQEIRARLDLAGTFSVDGPDNSHFIAHAPADIAWLLAEVERWQQVAERAQEEAFDVWDSAYGGANA